MNMNGVEKQFLEARLTRIEAKLQGIHDDVLVIKVEKREQGKLAAVIAAIITLALNAAMILWR